MRRGTARSERSGAAFAALGPGQNGSNSLPSFVGASGPSGLKCALSLIQHEWEVGNAGSDRRMFVVITGMAIRTSQI